MTLSWLLWLRLKCATCQASCLWDCSADSMMRDRAVAAVVRVWLCHAVTHCLAAVAAGGKGIQRLTSSDSDCGDRPSVHLRSAAADYRHATATASGAKWTGATTANRQKLSPCV